MEEIDLIEVFKIFWRRKIQIVLIILIFIGIGYIYTTKYVSPMYSSSTTLVLATSNNSNITNTSSAIAEVAVNTKLIATYKELITSKSVISEVISNLGMNMSENQLKRNITVTSVDNTSLIEIKVVDSNPENSSKIANETAKVFTKRISEIYNINNIQSVDEAQIPTSPYNINHKKDIVMFGLIGLLVSITYVIIANMFDTTIKSAEELEKMFNLPILVSIPMYGKNKKGRGGKK